MWTGMLALAATGEVRDPQTCRWSPHDPGSTVVSRDGLSFFSLVSRGVTVQASVQDTGHEIRVDVRVENRSEASIPIDPAALGFEILSPKFKQLKFEPAEKVASGYLTVATSTDAMSNGATFNRTPRSSENELAQREAARVRQTALRPMSLPPNEAVAGVVYFEREKKKEETLLRMPVGKVIFEFPFAWSGGQVSGPR